MFLSITSLLFCILKQIKIILIEINNNINSNNINYNDTNDNSKCLYCSNCYYYLVFCKRGTKLRPKGSNIY